MAAAGVLILLWDVFAAPKSGTRLEMPWLVIFKLAAFGAGTAALWALQRPDWAGVFGGLAAVHLIVSTVLNRV